jgi:pimeloyl-ACP methyl ester carboxylesterase
VLAQSTENPIELDEPVELFFTDSTVSQVTPGVMRLIGGRFLNEYPWFAPYLPRIIDELDAGETMTLRQALSGKLAQSSEQNSLAETEADELLTTAADLRSQANEQLEAQAREEARNRPGFRWLREVFSRASNLPDEQSEQALFELRLINMSPRTADALATYIDTFFTGDDAESLRTILNELNAEEIRSVFEIVSDLTDADRTDGMHYSIECYEEFPFNSLDEAQEIFESLRYPALGLLGLSVTEDASAVCEVWPTATAPAIEDETVVSSIPTLVMAGLYDNQTPPSWNRLALEGLTNAYYVEFPNTGHAVISPQLIQVFMARSVATDRVNAGFVFYALLDESML